MKTISEIGLLRRFGLPLLQLKNFNITIKHPWVADFRITLNSFLHQGYWFHGVSNAAPLCGNVFCLRHETHKEQLDRLFFQRPL